MKLQHKKIIRSGLTLMLNIAEKKTASIGGNLSDTRKSHNQEVDFVQGKAGEVRFS